MNIIKILLVDTLIGFEKSAIKLPSYILMSINHAKKDRSIFYLNYSVYIAQSRLRYLLFLFFLSGSTHLQRYI